MSSFLKWIGGCAMLTLPFSSTLFFGTPRVSESQDAMISLSRFETRVSEIATSVQRRFAASVGPKPITASFLASDSRHLPVRDQFLEAHFERQAGHYLANIIHEGDSVFCQLRGLKLRGPETIRTSNEDTAIGITNRLRYTFTANSHRMSGDGIRWGDWNSGVPSVLSTIELANQDDGWSVDAIPQLLPFRPDQTSQR